MKILENLLFACLTVMVIGFFFGILESPLRKRPENPAVPTQLPHSQSYDIQNKIDEILGASGGRFRIFSSGDQVIRIDTATSRIAVLDPKKEAWMNLQVGERTLTGFANESFLAFLQSLDF